MTAPPAKRTLHVISHTHWDREWYLTFQQFRFRLVRLVDRLMDLLERDPAFRCFHLDAQTICIEDYLEIKPAQRERLLRLVRDGRILIGPWYQQNDVFLTSGESTIRNLLVGGRMAAEYAGLGRVMRVGYLPDQFGLCSQMPQILRGFGITSAVHGRGLDMPRETGQMEYLWESPDGSRVLTSYLAFWYNNFERIPADVASAVARVDTLERDLMAPVSGSRHLLLMNGVDHFEAQENLAPMMEAVNAARSGGRLTHSTLPDYFAALEAENLDLPVHRGELRDGPSLGGLAGTLSSRVNLKQANARCERLLSSYAEPLSLIAHTLGLPYPREYLTWAWKALMRNHPHDSICGCSQDQVHSEMAPRFEEVEQVAEEIIGQAFAACAARLPPPAPVEVPGRHTTFAVFNPLPHPRGSTVEVTLDFPLGAPGRERGARDDTLDVEVLTIYDAAGNPVVHHVSRSEIVQTRVLSPTVLPLAQIVRRFTVMLRTEDVPPLGFRVYRAVGQSRSLAQQNAGSAVPTGAVSPSSSLVPSLDAMENPHDLASVGPGGAFSLSSGYCPHLNRMEDGGDVGDQYVYRAPRRDARVLSNVSSGQVELMEDTPLTAAYCARFALSVPLSATQDREARADERVDIPMESTVRLRAQEPWVEVITTVNNRAGDHRLRALFALGRPAETTVAAAPFDVMERPRVPEERLSVVAGQHPHQGWVCVETIPGEEDPMGLAIFTDGLYEHELLRDDEGTLAITLLRCTDRLTMSEGDPLGHDRAPGGQGRGLHTFRYAVMPYTGGWEKAGVWNHAAAFLHPMRALQTPEPERESPDHNARPLRGETPGSFLTLESDTLILSACKQAEDRETCVIRFWNPGTTSVSTEISMPGASSAWRLNLAEERQEEMPFNEVGTVSVSVAPRQIITLEFDSGP